MNRLTQYATITRTTAEAASLMAGYSPTEEQILRIEEMQALTAATATTSTVTWSGVIGLENQMTGDGRLIETNALRWATLPIPLRMVEEDTGGHLGARVVGHINELSRQSGGKILGKGDLDMGSVAGREAARQIDEGLTTGISMDLDEVSFEIRVAKDLLDSMTEPMLEEDPAEESEPAEPETDSEDRVTVVKMGAEDEVMVTTDARIRAATLVAIPAFEEVRVTLDSPLADQDPTAAPSDPLPEEPVLALVAGGFPVAPKGSWFSDPHLAEPTRIKITDDGRFFGHLAIWGSCHTAYEQCVSPPASPSGYAHFLTGTVLTAEGKEVSTGRITMDTLHAGKSLSAAETLSHYEHTGRAVADVVVGEDSFGIWVAGALRPNVTDEQVRALRASPLSGDWRRQGGQLELVAALAVNVPGFPIPRPSGLVASGVMQSLVASGMLSPTKVIPPGQPGALSLDDLRYLKRLADRERQNQHALDTTAAALALKVKAGVLARRVRAGAVVR